MKFLVTLLVLTLTYGALGSRDERVTIQVSGKLQQLWAIGGETTGIGLKETNGRMHELKGSTQQIHSELIHRMDNEEKITAYGYEATVRGPERGEREILVVTKIELLD